jgi:hypothetical protein
MKIIFAAAISLTLVTGAAHAEYVKATPGNEIAKAEAYCNMVASGAERGYFAFGNANYVAGAAFGSAIGNMIRVSQAKKNCMIMQGYEWKKPARAKRVVGAGTRKSLANE